MTGDVSITDGTTIIYFKQRVKALAVAIVGSGTVEAVINRDRVTGEQSSTIRGNGLPWVVKGDITSLCMLASTTGLTYEIQVIE